jgi:hypothetical protein
MINSLFNLISRGGRSARILITFYKNFVVLSLLLNVICNRLFFLFGFSIFIGLFWIKIISYLVAFFFVNSNKKNEYFFYQNIGFKRKFLWLTTTGFDFVLFIITIFITNTIK